MRHPEKVRREFAEQDGWTLPCREAEEDHRGPEDTGDLCNGVHEFPFPPVVEFFSIITLLSQGIKSTSELFSHPLCLHDMVDMVGGPLRSLRGGADWSV